MNKNLIYFLLITTACMSIIASTAIIRVRKLFDLSGAYKVTDYHKISYASILTDVKKQKLYYVWLNNPYLIEKFEGQSSQICTAVSDMNGENWEIIHKTESQGHKDDLSAVYDFVTERIYYIWRQSTFSEPQGRGSVSDIYTGQLDIDGIGWEAINRTNTAESIDGESEITKVDYNDPYIVFNEKEGVLHYAWCREQMIENQKDINRSIYDIEVASMYTNGAGWMRNVPYYTEEENNKKKKKIQISLDIENDILYYVYIVEHEENEEIRIASMYAGESTWKAQRCFILKEKAQEIKYVFNREKKLHFIYGIYKKKEEYSYLNNKKRYFPLELWVGLYDLENNRWVQKRQMISYDNEDLTQTNQFVSKEIYYAWTWDDTFHSASMNAQTQKWKKTNVWRLGSEEALPQSVEDILVIPGYRVYYLCTISDTIPPPLHDQLWIAWEEI